MIQLKLDQDTAGKNLNYFQLFGVDDIKAVENEDILELILKNETVKTGDLFIEGSQL